MVKSICIKFTYLIAQYYFVPLNQHAMQFSGSFMNSTFSKLKSYQIMGQMNVIRE